MEIIPAACLWRFAQCFQLRLRELVFALVGIASIEDVIGDAVWVHCLFSEFSMFRTSRRAGQTIHSLSEGTGSDSMRRGDEVDLSTALAHDAHMDRHGIT